MKIINTLLVLLLPAAGFSQTSDVQKWKKIQRPLYGIQSPAAWSIDTSKQMGTDLVFFAPLENTGDRFRENVNVIVQPLEGRSMTIEQYTAISERQIKTMAADARIIESKKITVGANPYQKIIYTATQSGFKLQFEQYYFVSGSRAFVLTFTAEQSKFDNYKSTGEQVLNTFMLKKI